MEPATTLNALAVARRIADRLDEDGLEYGVGGALALGAWGAPRATKDADITVFVPEAELPRCFHLTAHAPSHDERRHPPRSTRPTVGSPMYVPEQDVNHRDARGVLDDWKRSGETLEAFARSRGLVPQRLAW